MKTCSACKILRPLGDFTKNKSKPDGLNHNCRECHRRYTRDHYTANKQYYFAKAKRNDRPKKAEIKALISSLKNGKSCLDCGQLFPEYVMDFDHLWDKKFIISKAFDKTWSLEKIKAEISKCELVCANCHRIRTHNRRQALVVKSDIT